jgi:hypothetical protein
MGILTREHSTLGVAPLALLLADAHAHARTGTLQIVRPGGALATIILRGGRLAGVRIRSLDGRTRGKGGRGPAMHTLFGWEPTSRWEYFDGVDGLDGDTNEEPPPIDVRGVTWLGVRDAVPEQHVNAVLDRLGPMSCMLAPSCNLGRYHFDESERGAAECLRVRPLTLPELTQTGLVAFARARALFYVLALFGDLVPRAKSVPAPVSAPPPSVAAQAPVEPAAAKVPSTPPLRLSGVVRRPTSSEAPAGPRLDAPALLTDALRAHLRGDHERAQTLCRRAHRLGAHQAEALALLAWIEALDPAHQTPTEQHARLEVAERAARAAPDSAFVLFCRGSLRKRFGDEGGALRDFLRVLAVEPGHVDAQREVRLIEIRQRRRTSTSG